MRVLYLHQYFASPQSSTGTRSYEFAQRLIACGHQVCMITSSAVLPDKYQYQSDVREFDIDGIHTVIIPIPYSNHMSFAKRIEAFLSFALLASWQAIHHPSDVVFATSTPLTIAIPAIAAHLWQRIPMVFEVRDLWPELPIAVGALRHPLAQSIARALEWIAYHMSSHIIALSPGMANGIVSRGIPQKRITVIPNGCDVKLFDVPAAQGEPIRVRLGIAPGQPLVVYAGAFGLVNGVGFLIDVAKEVLNIAPEIHFLLVGAGAEYEQVIRRAYQYGVLGINVSIWEPIRKSEMPSLLAAATVATSVFIPLQEMWNNSANKFFDALAAGKPIAINYGGWQADLLQKTGAGIVLPPNDILEAARRLASFVRDDYLLKRAAIAASNLAYTEYDRDVLAQRLENVLKQAVGES